MNYKDLNPIAIGEDTNKIMESLSHIDISMLPYCAEIQRAFEDLKVLELNDEYLSDMLEGNCEKTIRDFINYHFKKLRSAIGILEESCKKTGCRDLLKYLSISKNGNITFTEESKERLKDAHRKLISTPEGIRRYNLHLKAAEAINALMDEFGGRFDAIDLLDTFDVNTENRVFPVTEIDYE